MCKNIVRSFVTFFISILEVYYMLTVKYAYYQCVDRLNCSSLNGFIMHELVLQVGILY